MSLFAIIDLSFHFTGPHVVSVAVCIVLVPFSCQESTLFVKALDPFNQNKTASSMQVQLASFCDTMVDEDFEKKKNPKNANKLS